MRLSSRPPNVYLHTSDLKAESSLVAFGLDLTSEPGASLLSLCIGKHFDRYKGKPRIFFALPSDLDDEAKQSPETCTQKILETDHEAEGQYTIRSQIRMLQQLTSWFAYDGEMKVPPGSQHAVAIWKAYKEAREMQGRGSRGEGKKKENQPDSSLPETFVAGMPSLSAGSVSSAVIQSSELLLNRIGQCSWIPTVSCCCADVGDVGSAFSLNSGIDGLSDMTGNNLGSGVNTVTDIEKPAKKTTSVCVPVGLDIWIEADAFKVWTNWKNAENRLMYLQYRKQYHQAFDGAHGNLNPDLWRLFRNEYRFAVIRLLEGVDQSVEQELHLRLPPSWFGKTRSAEMDRRVEEKQALEVDFRTFYWRDSMVLHIASSWGDENVRKRVKELLSIYLKVRTPYLVELWAEWEGERGDVRCRIRSRVLQQQA